eukprot:TRINITY_DN10561_c0_g1_i3.p1 TRINITY_DN10561_c0_g1~~TRINITY_DN10561_c0_g1_i3.p1  ORF type:complete len:582 (-),score=96.09 TRINITY_DN10561_c0_g1_i3:79-1824(-)
MANMASPFTSGDMSPHRVPPRPPPRPPPRTCPPQPPPRSQQATQPPPEYSVCAGFFEGRPGAEVPLASTTLRSPERSPPPPPPPPPRPPPRNEPCQEAPEVDDNPWKSFIEPRPPPPTPPPTRASAELSRRLRKAAELDDVNEIQQLVSDGAYFGDADRGGKVALHYAARAGSFAAVKLLLHLRADPNANDMHGGRPRDESEWWAVKQPAGLKTEEAQQLRLNCLKTLKVLASNGAVCSDQHIVRRRQLEKSALARGIDVPWLMEGAQLYGADGDRASVASGVTERNGWGNEVDGGAMPSDVEVPRPFAETRRRVPDPSGFMSKQVAAPPACAPSAVPSASAAISSAATSRSSCREGAPSHSGHSRGHEKTNGEKEETRGVSVAAAHARQDREAKERAAREERGATRLVNAAPSGSSSGCVGAGGGGYAAVCASAASSVANGRPSGTSAQTTVVPATRTISEAKERAVREDRDAPRLVNAAPCGSSSGCVGAGGGGYAAVGASAANSVANGRPSGTSAQTTVVPATRRVSEEDIVSKLLRIRQWQEMSVEDLVAECNLLGFKGEVSPSALVETVYRAGLVA